jgi:hypothetical protein
MVAVDGTHIAAHKLCGEALAGYELARTLRVRAVVGNLSRGSERKPLPHVVGSV